ncbi:MAG: DUF169 domain-containing protein [Clostridia bacterium]|nr:DUF169 domain-containing protein [Clostridia bacterium]
MDKKLAQMLHLELEPVGIFFGNTAAKCDLEASPDKRNCVVPFLLSAAKGKIVSMDEASCNWTSAPPWAPRWRPIPPRS